jgi:hypothetical protein
VEVLGEGQHEEGHVKGDKEENEGDRVTENSEEHQECKDEPSKQVERDRHTELLSITTIGSNNVEARDLNDSIRQPESTIAAQSSSAKRISDGLEIELVNDRNKICYL